FAGRARGQALYDAEKSALARDVLRRDPDGSLVIAPHDADQTGIVGGFLMGKEYFLSSAQQHLSAVRRSTKANRRLPKMLKGFWMTAHRGDAACTSAIVRKPPAGSASRSIGRLNQILQQTGPRSA